jgi:GH15 family glucan-1,4-alpha-glucosidase
VLARRNDVDLLAEEVDPHTGRMLGNFPQAYSHDLINPALSLSRPMARRRTGAQSQAPVA